MHMITSTSDLIHTLIKTYQSMEERRFSLVLGRASNEKIQTIATMLEGQLPISDKLLSEVLQTVGDTASITGKKAFILGLIKAAIEFDSHKIDANRFLDLVESIAGDLFKIAPAAAQDGYVRGVVSWMGGFMNQVSDDTVFIQECKLILFNVFVLYSDDFRSVMERVSELKARFNLEQAIADVSFSENQNMQHLQTILDDLEKSEGAPSSMLGGGLSVSVQADELVQNQKAIDAVSNRLRQVTEGEEQTKLQIEFEQLKMKKDVLIQSAAGNGELRTRLELRIAELQQKLVSSEETLKAAFEKEQKHWKQKLAREQKKASRRGREVQVREQKVREHWLVGSVSDAKIVINHGKKLIDLRVEQVELEKRLIALNKVAQEFMPEVAPDADNDEALAKAESASTTLPSHMNFAASCYLKVMNFAGSCVGAYAELYHDDARISFLEEYSKPGVAEGMIEKSRTILRELESIISMFYERSKVQAGMRHVQPPKAHEHAVQLHDEKQIFFKALADAAESLIKCFSNLVGEGYIKKFEFTSWSEFVEVVGPFAAKNYLHINHETNESIKKSKKVMAGFFKPEQPGESEVDDDFSSEHWSDEDDEVDDEAAQFTHKP